MWELATDAKDVLFRLEPESRAKVLRDLQPLSDEIRGGKSGQRLFFTLDKADNIPLCLLKMAPQQDRVKGSWTDLWDVGSTTYQVPHYLVLLIGLVVLGLVVSAILFGYQQWILAIIVLSVTLVGAAGWAIYSAIFGFEWILEGSSAYSLPRYVLLLVVPFAVSVLGCAIALFHRNWILAIIAGVLALVLPAVVFFVCWLVFSADWLYTLETLDFAFVMAAVVSLLGIEWLTRKLLKLA